MERTLLETNPLVVEEKMEKTVIHQERNHPDDRRRTRSQPMQDVTIDPAAMDQRIIILPDLDLKTLNLLLPDPAVTVKWTAMLIGCQPIGWLSSQRRHHQGISTLIMAD